MDPWLLAPAGAALLLLLLALKLRGPRNRTDLTGPPKRRGRAFTAAEAERIGELVAGGERAEALRLIRAAGHEESEALKLVELIERLAAGDGGKTLP
jgi:hypothetical protein